MCRWHVCCGCRQSGFSQQLNDARLSASYSLASIIQERKKKTIQDIVGAIDSMPRMIANI
jgi:hypothetical protein